MPELLLDKKLPEALSNAESLAGNTYPGRIAVMGLNSRGDTAIQVYGIMGRSAGSRDRIFVDEGMGSIRTVAPGKTQEEMAAVKNAELIYYRAARAGEGVFVISNGAQTDHVYESTVLGANLDTAVRSAPFLGNADLSRYEPDEPNFTPRITGVIDLRPAARTPFGLAIIRKDQVGDEALVETYEAGNIRAGIPGVGLAIQTYLGDGSPLPAFDRTPYALPMGETASSTADEIWGSMDRDNRVAIMARAINLRTLRIEETCIINAPT